MGKAFIDWVAGRRAISVLMFIAVSDFLIILCFVLFDFGYYLELPKYIGF